MPQGEEAVDEDMLSIFAPNSLFDSGHQSESGDSRSDAAEVRNHQGPHV